MINPIFMARMLGVGDSYLNFFFFRNHPSTFLHHFLNVERFRLLPSVASRGHPKSGPTALVAGLKLVICCTSIEPESRCVSLMGAPI